MVHEGRFLLLLNFSFLLLDLLLLLDLKHVILTLDSCLLSEGLLLLGELFLSSDLEVSLDPLPLLVFESFSLPGLSLTLLEGSLGAKSIDLSLSISGFLLELSKSLDLPLFLVLDSLGLKLSLVLLLISCLLVSNNLHLLVLLLLGALFLLDQGLSIGLGSLLHKGVDPLSLGLSSGGILLLHLLDVGEKLESLLVADLLLLHPLDGPLLDLVHDDLSALLSSLGLSGLSLLLLLEDLESLDLHH
mgnify:CR=1 FL=1